MLQDLVCTKEITTHNLLATWFASIQIASMYEAADAPDLNFGSQASSWHSRKDTISPSTHTLPLQVAFLVAF
jgi:hypothetical protein